MKTSKDMRAPHLRFQTKYTREGVRDMVDKRFLRTGRALYEAKTGAKRGQDGAYHYPPLVKVSK